MIGPMHNDGDQYDEANQLFQVLARQGPAGVIRGGYFAIYRALSCPILSPCAELREVSAQLRMGPEQRCRSTNTNAENAIAAAVC